MKKIFLTLMILIIGIIAQASDNVLHTVVLEGTNDGYNIILKTDAVPTISKRIKSNNTLILDVKGIQTTNAVNAIYKSTNNITGLVVENVSNNELKIYIQAKDIANSTILAEPKEGKSVILSERFPIEKILWTVAVIGILALLVKSAKSLTDYENSIVIKRDIKEREIELYKNFQRELATMPKMSYKLNEQPRLRRNYKELARR